MVNTITAAADDKHADDRTAINMDANKGWARKSFHQHNEGFSSVQMKVRTPKHHQSVFQMVLLNFQPRIMHFNRSDWFTQYQLSEFMCLCCPSDKLAEKSTFCELSTDKIKEMLENAIPEPF